MHIINSIDIIVNNYKKVLNIQDSITEYLSFSEWVNLTTEKSKIIRECSEQNDACVKEIVSFCSRTIATKEDADELFARLTKAILEDDLYDFEIILPICDVLISYYKENFDLIKLMKCYYRAATTYNSEYCVTVGKCADSYYLDELFKLVKYHELFDFECKFVFINAYYTAITFLPTINTYDNNEYDLMKSIHYFNDLKFFFNNYLTDDDRNNPELRDIYDFVCDNIPFVLADNRGKIDSEIRIKMENECNVRYLECINKNSNLYDVPSEVYFRYLMNLIKNKKITAKEAYLNYRNYTFLSPEFIYNKDCIYEIKPLNLLSDCLLLLNECSDKEFMIDEFEKLNEKYIYFSNLKYSNMSDTYLIKTETDWVFSSLDLHKDSNDILKSLVNLMKNAQINTYLHSIMVKNLADVLFECSYRVNSSLYKDTGMNYEELKDYVGKCALIHDIGKIRINSLINNQSRKLTIKEFSGLRYHPELGANLVSNNSKLVCYKDPILFHHKWYDGSKGYPNIDNTNSKVRIVTDIITICDCIDAATDFVGRAYKNNKSFSDVLKEMSELSGTRYNPDLMNIINNDKFLINIFERITGDFRQQTMYKAFIESLLFEK